MMLLWELKSIDNPKIPILHLQICNLKSAPLNAQKPDKIGLLGDYIFFIAS